ncbi:hypothetical protein CPC08DRAFT_770049 [Agrocybe pediades]|nr:hypothetical protein CPC08DRAFT_770049 [Agrocybe pediades]
MVTPSLSTLLVLKRGNTVGRWDISTVSSDVGQVLAQVLCNPKVPFSFYPEDAGQNNLGEEAHFFRWPELIPEETTLIIRLGTDDYLLHLRANATS